MGEWITGIQGILNPEVLLFALIGVLIGLVIGALPGLSGTMAVAIFTPLTFWFPPAAGFAMLIGIWNSSVFSGGISAIIINTPGTPASIASCFDGYAMYKRGQGGLALGINVIFSVIGGLISTVLMMLLAFPIARFAVKFGPSDYFALALLGISMMVGVTTDSVLKGLISGFLGFCLSTIGMDPISGVKRFCFGNVNLMAGISFIPVMIGVFGVGEALYQIYTRNKEEEKEEEEEKSTNMALGRVLMTKKEFTSLLPINALMAIVATFIGAVPACGGDIASIICWGQAKRFSKHPEEYGKGSIEGFSVSCTANNGIIGGALTTMLCLGIPGDAVSAVLIGSLMMYGMQPGPKMFTEERSFVIKIMLMMVLCNLMILVIGLLTAKLSAKVLNVKKELVWVSVIILSIVGSYALNNSFFDVLVMLTVAILGFVCKTARISTGPLILGLLLGNMVEANLRRAMTLTHGDLSFLYKRPMTLFLLLFIVLTFAWPILVKQIKSKKQ